VNVQEQPQEASARHFVIGKVVGEAIVVAVLGALLALGANWVATLKGRGLNLARDYFPQVNAVRSPTQVATNTAPVQTTTNEATPPETESPIARLKSKGLQVVDFDEVKKLLHDPGFQTGSIIFLDAREDEPYQAGHIPGAYQLDYYHPDKHLLKVLPLCQNASKIVVYCSGGDCQDSEMTALMLRDGGGDGGVPNEKLFVYSGGMTEWGEKKEPIETGARNSGQMLPANK
jgi:rhodanese-related sulfurtransferase